MRRGSDRFNIAIYSANTYGSYIKFTAGIPRGDCKYFNDGCLVSNGGVYTISIIKTRCQPPLPAGTMHGFYRMRSEPHDGYQITVCGPGLAMHLVASTTTSTSRTSMALTAPPPPAILALATHIHPADQTIAEAGTRIRLTVVWTRSRNWRTVVPAEILWKERTRRQTFDIHNI